MFFIKQIFSFQRISTITLSCCWNQWKKWYPYKVSLTDHIFGAPPHCVFNATSLSTSWWSLKTPTPRKPFETGSLCSTEFASYGASQTLAVCKYFSSSQYALRTSVFSTAFDRFITKWICFASVVTNVRARFMQRVTRRQKRDKWPKDEAWWFRNWWKGNAGCGLAVHPWKNL